MTMYDPPVAKSPPVGQRMYTTRHWEHSLVPIVTKRDGTGHTTDHEINTFENSLINNIQGVAGCVVAVFRRETADRSLCDVTGRDRSGGQSGACATAACGGSSFSLAPRPARLPVTRDSI